MRSYTYVVAESEVDLSGIVGAVAARARAMTPEFGPGGFLEGLSGQLQGSIPHDRVTVLYLDEGGRTFSVFAEHAARDAPRGDAATLSLWLEPAGTPSPRPSHPVSLRGKPSSSATHSAMPAASRGPPFPAFHSRGRAQWVRCRSWV